MTAKLSQGEVEDFWALGISIEAPYVPTDEFARALADGRVQDACCFSSMGTAETYWRCASPGEPATEDQVVVPPGQRAYETPWEDRADDRDVDGVLWKPWRRERLLRLIAGVPEARAPAVIALCARVVAALDLRFSRNPKPRPPARDAGDALTDVMRRIDGFTTSLDKDALRFAVVRAVVALVWGHDPIDVDVDGAWR